MLTDRENRPALAVALTAHALMTGLLTVAACFAPLDGIAGAPIAMAVVFLYFACVIGGIAWLAESPIVRRLNGSPSQLAQAAGCVLFLIGLVAIATSVALTWTHVAAWSYAGFALLSGCGAIRQFRRSAADDRPPAPLPLPSARLVR
ncbi:MAG TPA: hypothetical protein VL283_05345 [Candidatus Baltobacteraceae bacterium]|nr:hypothetical protein [Candidatus Baltobacteraceae bacterium]